MNAEQFARRLDEMRVRVQDMQGRAVMPDEAVAELLHAVEQLRLAQEELRHQNEALEAAHDELLEERRRYQHLFQYAPDAYLLTDLSGIVREARPEDEPIGGIAPAELLNPPIDEITGGLEDEIRVPLDEWPGVAVEGVGPLAAGYYHLLGE